MLRRTALVILLGHLAFAKDRVLVGPKKGSLVVVGGGDVGKAIVDRFLTLAGGVDAPIVIIPTADGGNNYDQAFLEKQFLVKAGAKNVTILHTNDRNVANSAKFVKPLKKARAVWFGGGRQWRLVDSYLYTQTQREIEKVLKRGGVVGGSSAGATIIGSYLVRGAREGNTIMMAPGYEVGLGLLRGVGVDQHLLKRNRQDDMVAVIEKHPELLGIGIDESTAIVVKRDEFEVVGVSKVAIYDPKYAPVPGAKKYYFLNPGDRFDLAARKRLESAATSSSSQD